MLDAGQQIAGQEVKQLTIEMRDAGRERRKIEFLFESSKFLVLERGVLTENGLQLMHLR